MRAWRAVALLPVLVLPAAWAADAPRTARERVATARAIASPCLSIETDRATVSLSIPELERAVAARPVDRWRNEDERLALIRGDRADELLGAPRLDDADPHGCARLPLQDAPGDGLYLVGKLIEAGTAAVSRPGVAGFVDGVFVRRSNPRCQEGPMGVTSYHLTEDGRPFMVLVTCVT